MTIEDELCNRIKRELSYAYRDGKREGVEQERREIIRKLRHHLRSRANDDSLYINGVLDALEIIEQRSQGDQT